MKLMTEYDMGNEIKNVNELYTPLKMLRNNKRFMIGFHLPFCTMINLLNGDFLYALKTYPIDVLKFTIFYSICDVIIAEAMSKTVDRYKYESEKNLKKLVSELSQIDVDTNYDLLLQSKRLKTKYHFYLNDHTVPILSESKYFFVPTHESDSLTGEVVLQEHNVGAKKYYLSKAPVQKAEELLLNPQKRMNLSLRRV